MGNNDLDWSGRSLRSHYWTSGLAPFSFRMTASEFTPANYCRIIYVLIVLASHVVLAPAAFFLGKQVYSEILWYMFFPSRWKTNGAINVFFPPPKENFMRYFWKNLCALSRVSDETAVNRKQINFVICPIGNSWLWNT